MNNSILVINSGSSSLKFAVLINSGNTVIVEGVAERLNSDSATITFKFEDQKSTVNLQEGSHEDALKNVKQWLDAHPNILNKLTGIGHRVVHGGESFTQSAIINASVIQHIKDCIPLAPLHNPAGIKGIEICLSLFNTLPQVAVFDTSFHQTLDQVEYLYPIPIRYYRENSLRKYGFHGTSFRYISKRLSELKPDSISNSLIVAHLGNGASTCAISHGKSVDTSMGLTPLEGMMMGTRSGNVDPMLLSSIANIDSLTLDDTLNVLNKESGLLGISELSNDCRELEKAMNAGDNRAKLALEMFCQRAAKSIASVATSLTDISYLVFTGGIGENSSYIRQQICQHLNIIGIQLEPALNSHAPKGEATVISPAQHTLETWIIPTNEELMIALDTIDLINK